MSPEFDAQSKNQPVPAALEFSSWMFRFAAGWSWLGQQFGFNFEVRICRRLQADSQTRSARSVGAGGTGDLEAMELSSALVERSEGRD